jgi:hypothetical protein
MTSTSCYESDLNLELKEAPLFRSDFRYIEIVKYYNNVPLKRGRPSNKATFLLPKGWVAL